MYTFKRAGFRKGRKMLLRDTIIAVWSTSFTSRYEDFLRTRATVSNSMLGSKFWLVLQKTPALEQGYNHASGNTTFAAFNSDLKISLWVWARVRLKKFLANCIPRTIARRRFFGNLLQFDGVGPPFWKQVKMDRRGGGRKRKRKVFSPLLEPTAPLSHLGIIFASPQPWVSFIFQNGDRVTPPSKLPKLELFPDGH